MWVSVCQTLASAARCGPHPPHRPRYDSGVCTFSADLMLHSEQTVKGRQSLRNWLMNYYYYYYYCYYTRVTASFLGQPA